MARITDELRDWVSNHYSGWSSKQAEGFAIADRIDANFKAACESEYAAGVMSVPIAVDESKWVKLPVDADGEVIHIGDVLDPPADCDDYMPLQVVRLTYDGYENEWFFDGETGGFTGMVAQRMDVAGWTHHHEPTVEDVLDEMLQRFAEDNIEGDLIDFIAEYAAKLQLKED